MHFLLHLKHCTGFIGPFFHFDPQEKSTIKPSQSNTSATDQEKFTNKKKRKVCVVTGLEILPKSATSLRLPAKNTHATSPYSPNRHATATKLWLKAYFKCTLKPGRDWERRQTAPPHKIPLTTRAQQKKKASQEQVWPLWRKRAPTTAARCLCLRWNEKEEFRCATEWEQKHARVSVQWCIHFTGCVCTKDLCALWMIGNHRVLLMFCVITVNLRWNQMCGWDRVVRLVRLTLDSF